MERPLSNAGYGFRDGDARQAATAIERIISDASHSFWNNEFFDFIAFFINQHNTHKYIFGLYQSHHFVIAESFIIIYKYLHARQTAILIERITPDAGHRDWYGDARQTATALERIPINAGHGFRNVDARQTATAFERTPSNAGHGVRDSDARQTATAIERIRWYVLDISTYIYGV
jgi:hypothetical protein